MAQFTSSRLEMPITFQAIEPRLLHRRPDCDEEYWIADVLVSRGTKFSQLFKGILFVEVPGSMVFLAGIENQKGIDVCAPLEFQMRQTAFITFLREEDLRLRTSLGHLASLFSDIEYASVAKATAAYLHSRALSHPFGIGYISKSGDYIHMSIEPGQDYGFRI